MLNTLDSHNDLTATAAPHAWSLEGLALDAQADWEAEQREADFQSLLAERDAMTDRYAKQCLGIAIREYGTPLGDRAEAAARLAAEGARLDSFDTREEWLAS